jgi:type II secretory pathway pseudopilin PulG
LISLAICSTLLVAVATAYVGASHAITNNDDFTRATQSARVILAQFEEQVRTGTPNSNYIADSNGNITSFQLTTASGAYRTYTYNASTKQLVLYTNATSTGTAYVVARNVTACSLTAVKGTDANGLSCVTQAALTITVTVGTNSITLSGSAAPRKSMQK